MSYEPTIFSNGSSALFHWNGKLWVNQLNQLNQLIKWNNNDCDNSDGYSMADIVYIWAKGANSIALQKGLELPQFKIVGHRQSTKLEILSTGKTN